jgi:hypothetical protein
VHRRLRGHVLHRHLLHPGGQCYDWRNLPKIVTTGESFQDL